MTRAVVVCALLGVILGTVIATASTATRVAPEVLAFPSSQTIPPTGPVPAGAKRAVSLNAARGEWEGAWLVARGGADVQVSVEPVSIGPLQVELAWGHFVRFGTRLVPDALLPWDGSPRSAEQPNQPIYLRVKVPAAAEPGVVSGMVSVTVDGATTSIPISVRVFPLVLAAQLPTSFHVSPATYLNTLARLHDFSGHEERQAANGALFRFLAEYGISPSSWGFGEPRSPRGYASSKKWWLDSETNMVAAANAGFPTMRIPISSNRTAPASWIAGVNPSRPETWCQYLQAVRAFWQHQGWLGHSLPFLYAQDEPDLAGQRLVARQAKALHSCWPGAKALMTGNPEPSRSNDFLWDGRGGDDLDIWVVLSRRHYGKFTSGTQTSRERMLATSIERVRRRATVWSYTYSGVPGTPGLAANEPLSNPRMYLLWNALEDLHGILYGQGTTSYPGHGNPFDAIDRNGEQVLLYPAAKRPVPSARLEQIRDGIEDWVLFDMVRKRHGHRAVRSILGGAGLFSADRRGVKLACRVGCQLRSRTKYSWPLWSRDVRTADRIEAARRAALTSMST